MWFVHFVPLLSCFWLKAESQFAPANKSFGINYQRNSFVKDGQSYRFIAGSIHYFRVPNFYWRDRLEKMKAGGLNAISTYVPWNLHEPWEGHYEFSGDANITNFLGIAQDLGLDVILRAGPYICGEWDFGGLPWWLLKHKDMQPRTSDQNYMAAISRFYAVFFPKIVPYLYKNGGPIIMLQVENEYGSNQGCDMVYKAFLRDLFRQYVGDDTLLITTDGGAMHFLKCGYIPGVYPTIDFGSWVNEGYVQKAFQAQRTYAPEGPLVNMELYPGWLNLWGDNHTIVQSQTVTDAMKNLWGYGASYNFYVYMGGTNFAYWNSADTKQPVTTSYDYNAPLSEAGDPTEKLFAIRREIVSMTGWQLPSVVPPALPKADYGTVSTEFVGTIFDLLDILSPPHTRVLSQNPMTMEDIDHPFGFVLYETVLPSSGFLLYGGDVKDRAYVHIDGVFQGMFIRKFITMSNVEIRLGGAQPGQKLQILVENTGRLTSGYYDSKGIVGNVSLDGNILKDWTMYPIYLSNAFNFELKPLPAPNFAQSFTAFVPSLYMGRFIAQTVSDTFFDPTGWTKGQFLVNRHNAGRYWPVMGPQVTLYTPKTMLNTENQILLFELEGSGNCLDSTKTTCFVKFTDRPYIDKPTNVPKV